VAGSDGGSTGFGYDGNGNQVAKVERPAGGLARTWTYSYDQDNRLVNVSHHSEQPPATRWATGATASSSLYPGGEAAATGAPDTTVCGAAAKAWVPMPGGTSAWLQASYAPATAARGLRIHETGSTPSVKQVELVEAGGARHTVWSGTDATPCGGDLQVAFPDTSYPVAGVKVTTAAGMGVGLDAIGLEPVPSQGPEEQVAAYQYDANGLRVRKADSGGDRSFLLDGLSITAEYSAPGVREAWYTQSLARIDEVLSVVNGQGKYWYQADALGSVYALTTSTGAVQARGGYDVFGEPVAEGGAAVGQPFGFTGREHEVESGLVYARARFLDPAEGRWIRSDPLVVNGSVSLRWSSSAGLTADDIHRYAYIGADPVNGTDPTGLMRLGASWSNPESTWIKSTVQAALDLLRGGSEGEPVRCFLKYWKGNEAENPFLDGANNVRIEWAAGAERDSTLNGHTGVLTDIIYIDMVFPNARAGNYLETRSVLQFAQTIAHETMHNVYNQLFEGVPEYVGGLLITTSSPFHGRQCCSQIQVSMAQWLSLKVAGRL
jgi:RHS repeat-associated protein